MSFKGAATRVSIKEEAKKLFACRGFKEVTMKDICEVTGMSRGGLYRHFGSTAELFEEIWTDMIAGQEDLFGLAMRQKNSAKDVLLTVLQKRNIEMIDSQSSLSLAVYEYSHAVSSRFFESINNHSKEMWSTFLQYGIDRGEFKTVDVPAVVDMILFSYQGVRMWSSAIDVKEAAEQITKLIAEMLIN